MDLRWAGLACLLAAALAGCSGSAGSDDEELDADFEDLGLDATESTGIVRGVVVDEAIRPLEGAAVGLTVPGSAGQETSTNAAGAFGFDGLEPGTYFVQASMERHKPVQQSVEVVAGDDEPPIVKFVLQSDGSPDPFYNVFAFEGYIECTTSFLVLCGAPNTLEPFACEYGACYGNITNDRYTFTKYFVDNASLIQAEMMWESSQSLSPTMYFEAEALDGGDCPNDYFNNTEGHSPVFATINATQIEDAEIGEACGIYFSLFSGHNEPLPRMPGTGWGIGATAQQQFTMYIHSFYGYQPPPGWRFTVDGDPEPA